MHAARFTRQCPLAITQSRRLKAHAGRLLAASVLYLTRIMADTSDDNLPGCPEAQALECAQKTRLEMREFLISLRMPEATTVRVQRWTELCIALMKEYLLLRDATKLSRGQWCRAKEQAEQGTGNASNRQELSYDSMLVAERFARLYTALATLPGPPATQADGDVNFPGPTKIGLDKLPL